jgi:hypothetical protein
MHGLQSRRSRTWACRRNADVGGSTRITHKASHAIRGGTGGRPPLTKRRGRRTRPRAQAPLSGQVDDVRRLALALIRMAASLVPRAARDRFLEELLAMLAAGFLPAWRASRLDPLVVLKQE